MLYVHLCFTHTAARLLALAGKIQSVRKLRLKSIMLSLRSKKGFEVYPE